MSSNLVVVKVGTSTLTGPDGLLDRNSISSLAAQCARLYHAGHNVAIVSSGAVSAGREVWGQHMLHQTNQATAPDHKVMKHALAALGQPYLMQEYMNAFNRSGIPVGQVLVTRSDFAARDRFLKARDWLRALLDMRVIPILNENDTIATEQIRFGDNDTLAAMVASLLDAEKLVILSDVAGLYDRNPAEYEETKLGDPPTIIKDVVNLDDHLWQIAGGSGTARGTGGMRTKLRAAVISMSSGVPMVIAHGRTPDVLVRIVDGVALGTTFHPEETPLSQRARWIAYGLPAQGYIVVDARAREVISEQNRSVLPAGILECGGWFQPRDIVDVRDIDGQTFARGFTNYGESELRLIMGHKTNEIEKQLGFKRRDEVIHKDDLVMVSGDIWQSEWK